MLGSLGKRQDQYGLAIVKSESRLRTVERRIAAKDAGIGDADLEELARTIIALDESLAAENELAVPVELDQLLLEQLMNR